MNDGLNLGTNSRNLLSLWSLHKGAPSFLSFADSMHAEYSDMYQSMFFIRFQGEEMRATFIGQELMQREADLLKILPDNYLELFSENERADVYQIYDHARQNKLGITGIVQRRPLTTNKQIRRQFLSLPIVQDGEVVNFVNTDDAYGISDKDRINPERIAPGKTHIVRYEYFDPFLVGAG